MTDHSPKNKKFANYVTGASFHMTLSRNQIAALASIANQDIHECDRQLISAGGNASFVNSGRGLSARGLIAHRPNYQDTKVYPYYLTEEGKLLVQLLQRAGLISEVIKPEANAE